MGIQSLHRLNAIVFDFPCSFEKKKTTRKSIKIKEKCKERFLKKIETKKICVEAKINFL